MVIGNRHLDCFKDCNEGIGRQALHEVADGV